MRGREKLEDAYLTSEKWQFMVVHIIQPNGVCISIEDIDHTVTEVGRH